MQKQCPSRLYPRPIVSEKVRPEDNYVVVHGYDNDNVMLSCFTRVKESGHRGSCVKVVPNNEKNDIVYVMASSGYKVFDRTAEQV